MKKLFILLALSGTSFAFASSIGIGTNRESKALRVEALTEMPSALVESILHQASPTYEDAFGTTYAELLEAYYDADCTITLLSVDPATGKGTYRVMYGGIGEIVIDDAY
jgi:hypothetical protein